MRSTSSEAASRSALVSRDLDAAWKKLRDIAAEVDAELHAAFFCQGGVARICGSIHEHPQSTLALKPRDEAGFRQTMNRQCDWSSPD